MVSELKQYINNSNWQKEDPLTRRYEVLTYDDYEIYRTSLDEGVDYYFNKRCMKSIESMKQFPERYDYDWDQWEQQYLSELQKMKEYLAAE